MISKPIFTNCYVLRIVFITDYVALITNWLSFRHVSGVGGTEQLLQDVIPLVLMKIHEKRQSCYLFMFPEKATLSASADLLP